MATFYLMNNIWIGTVRRYAGELIDDAKESVAVITGVGGKLEPSATAGMATAATQAQSIRLRGGDPADMESVMVAALNKAQSDFDAAHDTVGNATPVITCAKQRMQQHFGALAAPGANYIAQFAAGAPIDSAGPFTRMVPPRTVQIARGGAGVVTVYTIDGTDADGAALQETINSNGAVTVQGGRAFATVTRVRSDVDPQVTTDVEAGNGFGLGCAASDLDAVGVDGVLEAPASNHPATGTIVPTTVPNGAHLYSVAYRVLPIATQAAHNHALS